MPESAAQAKRLESPTDNPATSPGHCRPEASTAREADAAATTTKKAPATLVATTGVDAEQEWKGQQCRPQRSRRTGARDAVVEREPLPVCDVPRKLPMDPRVVEWKSARGHGSRLLFGPA